MCIWQLRSSVPTGSNKKMKVVAGNSWLLHTSLCPSTSDGKWRTSFVFPTIYYLSCCLHRLRISLLLMYNSCQVRTQGPWKPLVANITQIIIGLMVPDNFLSFSFLSAQSNLSVKTVCVLCSCLLRIALSYRFCIACKSWKGKCSSQINLLTSELIKQVMPGLSPILSKQCAICFCDSLPAVNGYL